jgi:hypothetical protein
MYEKIHRRVDEEAEVPPSDPDNPPETERDRARFDADLEEVAWHRTREIREDEF